MVRQGIMDELIINICRATFHDEPAKIKRCSVGLSNYVFIVEIKGSKYTVRLSTEKNAYNDTVRLLGKLMEIGIPVPRVLYCVDFMGERGTKYKDKVVEVNSQIIDRLNSIYDQLWNEWRSL